MSRPTFIVVDWRNRRLSFSDELLMRLEARELLKIVRENESVLQRFEQTISLLHEPGCLPNSDKFGKYFVEEAFRQFVDTEINETLSKAIRIGSSKGGRIEIGVRKQNMNSAACLILSRTMTRF
jgi:hypothetical protein